MTAHTPGPWKAETLTSGVQVVSAPQSGVITEVYTSNSRERDAADAALIASAPDLLAALEAIAERPIYRNDDGTKEEAINELNSMIETARTAIAKARGEG